MKIVIADIPEEGLEIHLSEKLLLDDISLASPVEGDLSLLKTGSEISVTGTLRAEINQDCSRCLKEFSTELNMPLNVVFHPVTELGTDSHELKNDEMDMEFYEGEELDLRELMKEQVLLSVQMKPLCKEDCKGICPSCGTDLNTGSCSCRSEKTDPRMAALSKYFEKRKE